MMPLPKEFGGFLKRKTTNMPRLTALESEFIENGATTYFKAT